MSFNKSKKGMILLLSSIIIASTVGCTKLKDKEPESLSSTAFKTIETMDIKGNKVDNSVFSHNKLTLVNVWNKGCTPCIDEIPILDKLNKEYSKKGVSIKGLILESGVGLNEEERQIVEEILSKSKASYQQIITSEKLLNSDILKNIDAFPTTFFVDKDGNIVDEISGSNDYEGWKSLIEDTLKKVDSND